MKRLSKSQRGFSLLELMVAVSITGILLVVGVPSFQSTLLRARGATLADTLITAIYYARSEAISRNSRVSLCASIDGNSCQLAAAVTSWNSGWIAIDSTNTVIKIWDIDAVNSQVQLVNLGPPPAPRVNLSLHRLVYNSSGEAQMRSEADADVIAAIGFTSEVVGCVGMANQRRVVGIDASGRIVVNQEDC
ncbi:MAG: prepilin-type N-terminal cleavage/methylation domain-containing protein [Oceanospirillaceae bacterium]|jgi:prepilin-type N-terminal cleavage/methylation domain-containing protein